MINDSLMDMVLFIFFGTVHSLTPAFFITKTAGNALSTNHKFSEFYLALNLPSILLISIFTWLGLLPNINVFGKVSPITLLDLIFAVFLYNTAQIVTFKTVKNLVNHNKTLFNSLIEEKAKSDRLMINMMPFKIARELIDTGSVEPVRVKSATILFSDFVRFSSSTQGVEPMGIITSLNDYFSAFDEILERRGVEKLKTIGDGYMCAGGIPNITSTHPIDVCLTALDMLAVVRSRFGMSGKLTWDVRIGINTGSVIAGVIGNKKFSYDIWGEAVNIASRHESSGLPGSITVSKSTYLLTSKYFAYAELGPVEIKGGNSLEMFRLTGFRPEWVDPDGKPNSGFTAEYEKISKQA